LVRRDQASVRSVVTGWCDDAGTKWGAFERMGNTPSTASRLIVSVLVAYSV